mgnify:FL=1
MSQKKQDATPLLPAPPAGETPLLAAPKRAAGRAVVPYRAPKPPSLVGIGDLEAYLRFAEAAPMLSPEEEHSLALAIHASNDREALQKLIISHLRLVISIARGYLGYGLPYADLIQEGNIGLMKAVAHFDPNRGNRLMTFAVHWIRSEIQEYVIRNWRMVKMATTKNQRKLFFNLRQLKEDTRLALTNEQANRIALTLDVKPKEVFEMEERMYGQDTSLETPSSSSDDDRDAMTPADWLTSEDDTPEAMLEAKERERLEDEGIYTALHALDERSRRVIEARYLHRNADGVAKPVTLQELADELGVSAERVRQIEKNALRKMRLALEAEENSL